MQKKQTTITIIIALVIIAVVIVFVAVGPWEKKLSPEETAQVKAEATTATTELLAEKYNKNLNDVKVEILNVARDHVRGTVEFASGETGIVLAAKVNGDWQLAFEGNSALKCETITQFEFPRSMTRDCEK